MKTTTISVLLLSLAFAVTSIQAQVLSKPWTDWSKKDVDKMLNDSAWGQTQIVTPSENTSTAAITRTQAGGNEPLSRSGENPENMAPKSFSYRVRFLTARPIREAFARMILLSQPSAEKELENQLQGFVERDFGNFLVVAMVVESPDAKAANAAMMGLTRLKPDMLKDKVYLERKDGKRISLIDYKPPIADNMGAKFIFERSLDGQPFLSSESDTVKFVIDVERIKINLRFKVPSMTYNGKLEY
jgi:hypothetical protein